MTLAIVKVLPEPVTPKSTWFCFPSRTPRTSERNRLRLIAGRLEFADELKLGHAASPRKNIPVLNSPR